VLFLIPKMYSYLHIAQFKKTWIISNQNFNPCLHFPHKGEGLWSGKNFEAYLFASKLNLFASVFIRFLLLVSTWKNRFYLIPLENIRFIRAKFLFVSKIFPGYDIFQDHFKLWFINSFKIQKCIQLNAITFTFAFNFAS